MVVVTSNIGDMDEELQKELKQTKPFGSREEAVQVCSSLKQAGGDCVVQH